MKAHRILIPLFLLGLLLLPFALPAQEPNVEASVSADVSVGAGDASVEAAIQAEAELEASLPTLPDPGLTPSSPFYFLEKFVETMTDVLTFNPEAKARRHGQRALERVAEVKAMLEEKGVIPRGLDTALKSLRENAAKAAAIVRTQKGKGKDVSALARTLHRNFESHNLLLRRIFEEKKVRAREEHHQRKEALKAKLLEKMLTRSESGIGELETELDADEEQMDELGDHLDQKLEAIEEVIEEEEKIVEEALEEEERKREGRERQAQAALKEKRKLFHAHLKELRLTLKEREQALKDQLESALLLGEDREVEELTDTFTNTSVEATLEAEAQAAVSSFDAEAFFEAKKKARALHLFHKKKALELKGKALGHEIVKRREECLSLDVENLGQCVAERARTLHEELRDVAVREEQLEEEEDAIEEESVLEKDLFEDEKASMKEERKKKEKEAERGPRARIEFNGERR